MERSVIKMLIVVGDYSAIRIAYVLQDEFGKQKLLLSSLGEIEQVQLWKKVESDKYELVNLYLNEWLRGGLDILLYKPQ